MLAKWSPGVEIKLPLVGIKQDMWIHKMVTADVAWLPVLYKLFTFDHGGPVHFNTILTSTESIQPCWSYCIKTISQIDPSLSTAMYSFTLLRELRQCGMSKTLGDEWVSGWVSEWVSEWQSLGCTLSGRSLKLFIIGWSFLVTSYTGARVQPASNWTHNASCLHDTSK